MASTWARVAVFANVMTKGVLPVPPDVLAMPANVPTVSRSPATPSVRVTVMVPAPKVVALRPGVLPRSRSATAPAVSKATGSMDTAAPVEAFSVTVGLVAVWLMVGASFRGATAVLSVMVFDHVLVWPKATAALMSLLAPKVWALSATRTVSWPVGVPLKLATGTKRTLAVVGNTSAVASVRLPTAIHPPPTLSLYCQTPSVAAFSPLPTMAMPPRGACALPPPEMPV